MDKFVAALIIGALAFTGLQSEAADATVGADFMSAYVFRGITYNDSFVIQPLIEVADENGLSFNVWANWDAEDYGDVEGSDFQEYDLAIVYALPINSEVVEASASVTSFSFPNQDLESTSEIGLNIGFSVIDALSIGLELAYEFDEIDDYYAALILGYRMPVTDDIAIDLGAKAGYAGADTSIAGEEGFHDLELSLSTSIPAGEDISISLYLNYVDSLDDEVLPDDAVDVDFYGGVGVYYTF